LKHYEKAEDKGIVKGF